jgi:uncharacterized protein
MPLLKERSMRRPTITLAGAAALLLLLLALGRAQAPATQPAAAQAPATQPTAQEGGGADNAAIVQQLTQLNTKTDQVAQSLAQLNTKVEQLNTKTDQVAQALADVGEQTKRIADRLELRTVTGVGYAELPAAPDQATVQLDIKTLAPTLDAAIAENQQAVAAMKAQIGGAPIRVADPQIAPVLGDERKIEAYRVLTPLLVTIANPSDAGAKTLAQVVGMGGSSFKEIKYSVSEAAAKQAHDDARTQAFARAKADAQAYADKAGGTLGPVQSINEDLNIKTFLQPPPPGQPTEQLFTAEISVVFELVLP